MSAGNIQKLHDGLESLLDEGQFTESAKDGIIRLLYGRPIPLVTFILQTIVENIHLLLAI